jgi:transposase InsO family protein
LVEEIKKLAKKVWMHPSTGAPHVFSAPTIERWFYLAKNAGDDPVARLRRSVRKDSGQQRSVTSSQQQALRKQHDEHPSWSYKLHADNLRVRVKKEPALGTMPSGASVRRWMKANSLLRRKRRRKGYNDDGTQAQERFEQRERRSFEVTHVHGLWHLDFHHGSLKIVTAGGEWVTPMLLGILDDRSRLCCHMQWYLDETAESLTHGLSQAFQKRGLPRSLLTDNGSAMTADETTEGLARLGVVHETTLPYSPEQNAKQEVLWAVVEGRLMAMLEGVPELTLAKLNEATQAWVEMEYHRSIHSETGQTPIARLVQGPVAGRDCPSSQELRLAFTCQVSRTQRKSDGTFSLEGVRFEVPTRYRHFDRLKVRYPRWDLSFVHLVDGRTGKVLCRVNPLDKAKNADGARHSVQPMSVLAPKEPKSAAGMAPLLESLMADYASTGLPPAYLPKGNVNPNDGEGR